MAGLIESGMPGKERFTLGWQATLEMARDTVYVSMEEKALHEWGVLH